MAGWLESMQDIAGPLLSAGGMMAGGPVGGALGGSLGGMLSAGGETDGSAAATGTLSSGSWSTSFGSKSNLLLIGAVVLAAYFLLKGK